MTTKKVSLDTLQLGGSTLREVAVEIFDEALGNEKVSVLGAACDVSIGFSTLRITMSMCDLVLQHDFWGKHCYVNGSKRLS